jgi:glycerol-3-phosphate acyltransferase PlsX
VLTSTTTSTTTSSSQPDEPVVAVDCNGADLGPSEVAAGAALAAALGARVLLFGPAAELGAPPPGVEIVDAPVSIAKAEDPAAAARAQRDASIVLATKAVAQGRAQALVCAGGTGAAVAAGTFNIKRDRGIYRPALAIPLPVPGNPVTLLDVGASAEARREHLVQFAFMGAALAGVVLGVPRPRVGLLSNGEEDARGGGLVTETGAELRERMGGRGRHGAPADPQDLRHGAPADPQDLRHGGRADSRPELPFEFVGNVEGGDLLTGAADVVVTDGLTGNIALKVLEGTSQMLLRAIREAAMTSSRAKVGGLLLKGALEGLREEIDPEAVGGAYLLGLRRLGVVPHGRFTREGFAQAILRARVGAREDIVGRTHAALAEAGALRRSPASAADVSLRR